MNLDNLINYTALIQLISAVNFAYIFTHFHQRVYAIMFNEKKLIEQRFTSFINDMSVDLESLESMEPIETTRGATNVQSLEKLRDDFKKLDEEWDILKSSIIRTLNKVKSVKGVRSLFLYISLFCLVHLFNLATIQWVQCDFFILYTKIYVITSVFVPAKITFCILSSRWEKKSVVDCYKWTSKAFVFSFVLSIVLSGVFLYFGWFLSARWLTATVFTLAVLLPFYACLFSILYIVGYELYTNYFAGCTTKGVIKKQKDLHGHKLTLDASYKMFTTDPPDFR